MPVTFSSYRLGPGQRVSNKTVPPPWDWLLRRENELGPRRSKSRIIFAVLVPPLYVAVQAPALIVTITSYRLLHPSIIIYTISYVYNISKHTGQYHEWRKFTENFCQSQRAFHEVKAKFRAKFHRKLSKTRDFTDKNQFFYLNFK